MSTIKEFKILNLNIQKNDFSGVEVIIAELSEIQNDQFLNDSLILTSYSMNSRIFLFTKNSTIGKRILAFPQNNIVLDLTNFKEQNISLPNYKGIALYHTEYIEQHQNQLIFNNENDVVEDIVVECILMHHTDMYFLSIFRYIIYSEYENTEEGRDNINVIEIFNKFKKLCSYVLMEICKVQIPEYEQLTINEKSILGIRYNEIFEYGKHYLIVIPTYVTHREYVQFILSTELNDNEPDFPIFNQRCLLLGYENSLQRISNNLHNQNLLNHEFIKTNNSFVLKIFLTPFGFINKEFLVQLATSGKFNDFLDNYFKEFDILRIFDDQLKKELGTSLIFRVIGENKLFYFKRRPINDEYVPFGEQDRKTPVKTLIMKGQLNLTAID